MAVFELVVGTYVPVERNAKGQRVEYHRKPGDPPVYVESEYDLCEMWKGKFRPAPRGVRITKPVPVATNAPPAAPKAPAELPAEPEAEDTAEEGAAEETREDVTPSFPVAEVNDHKVFKDGKTYVVQDKDGKDVFSGNRGGVTAFLKAL